MCRGEIKIPPMITDELNIQSMLRMYSKGLRLNGHDQELGNEAWIHYFKPSMWMDKVQMNADFSSLDVVDHMAILCSIHVSNLDEYV